MDGGVVKLDVVFPLRIIEYPAPDMPATWIAHALDLEIVAQGTSPGEAARSLHDALMEMIAYRLSEGMTPVEWSPASEELWAAPEASAGEKLDRDPNAFGNTYPLSLHNGDRTELSDVYLRGICEKFGLDQDDFRKKL